MINEKKMKVISRPTCDGGKEVIAFYDPTAKLFYSFGCYSCLPETLSVFFDRLINEGSDSVLFHMCLGIPEFKKMLIAVEKEIKPQFKRGDKVIKYANSKPEIWVVGDFKGIKKCCSIKSGSKYRIKRYFISDETNQACLDYEDAYLGIEELQKCKEARSIIRKITKELKYNGLVGGVLIHKEKAYCF